MRDLNYYELHNIVMNQGERIFGSRVRFNKWLSRKDESLCDRPVNLINNYEGLRFVHNKLVKIKNGVN